MSDELMSAPSSSLDESEECEETILVKGTLRIGF